MKAKQEEIQSKVMDILNKKVRYHGIYQMVTQFTMRACGVNLAIRSVQERLRSSHFEFISQKTCFPSHVCNVF